MNRKIPLVIFLGFFATAIAFVIFVILPYGGIVFFDFQCHTRGCSGHICTPMTFGTEYATTCEWKPEYSCYQDCKARDFHCGFDAYHTTKCLECIDECRIKAGEGETQDSFERFNNCTLNCYR